MNYKLKSLVNFAYYTEFWDSVLREEAVRKFESLSLADKELALSVLERSEYGTSIEGTNAGNDAFSDAIQLYNSWVD